MSDEEKNKMEKKTIQPMNKGRQGRVGCCAQENLWLRSFIGKKFGRRVLKNASENCNLNGNVDV